jgi:hypothetical protein
MLVWGRAPSPVQPSEARRLDHRPRNVQTSTNRKQVEQAFQARVKSSDM